MNKSTVETVVEPIHNEKATDEIEKAIFELAQLIVDLIEERYAKK